MPFTEFDTGVLAEQLHERVRANRERLELRYYLGTVARYGNSLADAKHWVEHAKQKTSTTDDNGVIPRVAVEGDLQPDHTGLFVYGIGTIYRGLQMHVMKRSVPPMVARWLPGVRETLDPVTNVTGWMDHQYDVHLGQLYEGLLRQLKPGEAATTIEPVRVPMDIHYAIASAGMAVQGEKQRFDVGEDPRRVPPLSYLYITTG